MVMNYCFYSNNVLKEDISKWLRKYNHFVIRGGWMHHLFICVLIFAGALRLYYHSI